MPTFRRSFQRHPIPSEFGMKATQRESHRTNCGLFIHSLKGESWEWKENNRILFWFSEPFEVVFLFILVTTFLAWIAFWPIVVLFGLSSAPYFTFVSISLLTLGQNAAGASGGFTPTFPGGAGIAFLSKCRPTQWTNSKLGKQSRQKGIPHSSTNSTP